MKRTPFVVSAFGLALLAGLAPAASADMIDIVSHAPGSTEGLGAFSGTLSYASTGLTSATLSITLANESDEPGGRITGFVFRLPSSDPAAAATLASVSVTHPLFQDTGPGSAPPFGAFDGGAALGGDWTGGGSPAGGILIGQTGAFEFTITASDASLLTAASFMSETSPYDFIVRLRGFDNGGSDKVPGLLIPAPGVGGLLACCGLTALGRRRRTQS